MYTYEGKQIEATVEREVTQLYTFHSVLTTFKVSKILQISVLPLMFHFPRSCDHYKQNLAGYVFTVNPTEGINTLQYIDWHIFQ